MDKLAGRCVEILVERDGGTGYGSGLRLATSLVVTAGHVTEGGGRVVVRLFGGAPEEVVVTGRTVWHGARLDVALVELAPDARLGEVAPMTIGVVPDDAEGRLPFTAIGFPRHRSWTGTEPGSDPGTGPSTDTRPVVAARAGAPAATWRDSDQIDGMIPLGSSVKRGRLVLHREDGRRLEARDWSGFSGAGVVCEGSAVGVVVESAGSGGLEAVRLAAVTGTYRARADSEREPAPSAAAARGLLAAHGVVPESLRGPRPRRAAYEALLRQYAARCPELTGRDRELAGLMEFATGSDPYLMLVAGPWAGKTSLVTHFATASHPGLDVVSFVVSRRDGQMRVQQFHRALCDQLAALLGEFAPAEPDAAAFLSLWDRAARLPGRSLLLLVDGLDENDHHRLAEPSIASQLPVAPGPAAHVLVTSRHAEVPLDVDGSHPLRTCRRQVLAPFPAATGLLLRARQELDHVLGEPLGRSVLTAMAVAGGALSSRDIASISGESPPAVRRALERGLARVVEPRAGTPVRYTLAHDTLAEAVREDLEPEEYARTRDALDRWAAGFAAAGWPDDTPQYLTDAYPTLLLAEGAGPELAALASPARCALLRRRTDGDLAALAELAHAARLLAQAPDADLTLLTRVSLLRERIEDGNVTVPSGYPLLLVRLGRAEEGIQVARALQNAYVRADALLAIGEHLLDARPAEARNLVREAMAVPGRLAPERLPHTLNAALALARHGDPDAAGIARRALAENADARGWSLTTCADALAGIDPATARARVEEAAAQADPEDRPDLCGLLAPAFARLGDLDRFLELVAGLDRDGRRRALLTACGEFNARGGHRGVPGALLAALNREFGVGDGGEPAAGLADPAAGPVEPAAGFAESAPGLAASLPSLVESAAYQDEGLARRLLALPVPDAAREVHAALAYPALAAHGIDPRQPGARDELLTGAATSALANGHAALALSLARDIADPYSRADRLTDVALALLDSASPQDATGVVREVEAALDATRNVPPPAVLAALARAAAGAGRTGLAGRALELAVHTVLEGGDDSHAAWQARAVARAAAALGHVDAVLRIATGSGGGTDPGSGGDRIHRVGILLDAARAADSRADHGSSADRDLLVAQVTDIVAASKDPATAGWRTRVTHELIALHLRAGHAGAALDLARGLGDVDLPGRTLGLRARLLSGDVPEAMSLIHGTAFAFTAGSRQDRACRREEAAAMVVAMCDAGHAPLCRDLTARLAAAADPAVAQADGLWAHPWLAAACQATGLDAEHARLLDGLRHATLVTGADYGTRTVPPEAVVRLCLWDRYRAEAGRLDGVLADVVLTGLIEVMLEAGLVAEALPLVGDLPDDSAARCLALAAAAGSPPRIDLVRRSLAHGFTEEVIGPLAAAAPECLDEIAARLGLVP